MTTKNPSITPPPSLPMENNPEKEVMSYISSQVTPIFNKVLSEVDKNRMSVGGFGHSYCIYYPHNYRLYIDFDKSTLKSETDLREVGMSVINGKEYRFKDFLNCTVTIKSTQIEIRNYIEEDKKFLIELTTTALEQFKEIIDNKDNQCKEVLKEFIRSVGGSSRYIIKNRYCENKIWHEKAIDKIDASWKWDTSISKKAYNEKNVEFKTPMGAATYISNRAMEEVAPRVTTELQTIKEIGKVGLELNADTCKVINTLVSKSAPTLKEFHRDIQVHNRAIKDLDIGIRKLNKLLSIRQKKLTEW